MKLIRSGSWWSGAAGAEGRGIDAVREPAGLRAGPVVLQGLPLGLGGRGAEVELARQPLLGAQHLAALQPVAPGQRPGLVVLVLEPLLRVHVAEVEDLRDALHVLDVLRHRGAVHEDQVEALAGQQLVHLALQLGAEEVAHRRGREQRQPHDHARELQRLLNLANVKGLAMRRDALCLGRFLIGARQRADRHLVAAGLQVADHVERPDLAAALGRIREAVAEVENFHRFNIACSSSASASGAMPSR